MAVSSIMIRPFLYAQKHSGSPSGMVICNKEFKKTLKGIRKELGSYSSPIKLLSDSFQCPRCIGPFPNEYRRVIKDAKMRSLC
ncbi:hypothetical protein SAMN04487898_108152 [Pedobacter sp. ok626]|nr:hypothetical protein SAMN04487898_108152 [Pedobacter sp. ok626]